MAVVDSSVWIEYFNGVPSPETSSLDRMLGRERIVVGDLILAEVLQGFRREADFKAARAALGRFEAVTMLGPALAVQSAANYQRLRRRGVTVRKSVDLMIATWCVEHGERLLFADRDFAPCVRHLGLMAAATT